MKPKSSLTAIKSKFGQPILFNSFNCEEKGIEVFNQKDYIQFTSKLGIFIIRFQNNHLFFYSTKNDQDSFMYDQDLPSDLLIAVPQQTDIPYCFIVLDDRVYRIDGHDRKTQVYHSFFFKILSLHANKDYLFVGTNINCLERIDDDLHHFFIFNFAKESILAISSYKDIVCIVSSRSYLIAIDQKTLRESIKIPLTFTILDDVQIKVGEINGLYCAAILTDSKIHLISFTDHPFYYTYQSWIPADSVISYDIFNNSVVIVQKSKCDYNEYSDNFSQISVYPRFSSEPQFEWDITKEIEFICQIDIQPSQRSKLIRDRLNHISSIFGYKPSFDIDLNYSKIIQSSSLRNVFSDFDGNLWATSYNSLLYCVPMDEDMALFRGMLNFGYDYAAECSEDSSNDEIINFIYGHMISLQELQEIFQTTPPIDDISIFVNDYENKKEIIDKLNQYLLDRAEEGEKPPEIGAIAQNVYDKMSSYMHSDIDFVINHDQDQTKSLLYQIADDFYNENEEESRKIAEMYSRNLKSINKYINSYEEIDDQKYKIIHQSWNADAKPFWASVVIGKTYQSMKFYISLFIASYLHKSLILAGQKKTHYQYSKLMSKLEQIICSLASIYQISLNSHISFQLYPLKFNFEHFIYPLFTQFSYFLNSTDFLLDFIDKNSDDILNKIEAFVKLHKHSIIRLASLCENNNSSGEYTELLKKLNEIITSFENINISKSLGEKIKEVDLIDDKIAQIYNLSYEPIDELEAIKDTLSNINRDDFSNRLKEILNYSSNMKKSGHNLVISMIHLINGNTILFFKYFRRFKFYGIDIPDLFYKFVFNQTNKSDPQTFVSFVNEQFQELMFDVNSNSNYQSRLDLKIMFYEPFFKNSIRNKDYESAFNALMGFFSFQKPSAAHIKSLEYLIKSMKDNNCIDQFTNFPFGINRTKILNVMSSGSPSLLFLASSLYYRIGEYSKCGNVLLKYINSILHKTDSSLSELKKAKSAVILILSLMKNHNAYIRNSTTMCLLDQSYINTIRGKIELEILKRRGRDGSNYTPKEAATVFNNMELNSSDFIKIYNSCSISKTIYNIHIFKFIENLKDELSLQLFLYNTFDQNLSSPKNKFSGIWFHIIFAQHNFQCMSACIQTFLFNQKRKAEYNEPKIDRGQTGAQAYSIYYQYDAKKQSEIYMQTLKHYIACASMIGEIILVDEIEKDNIKKIRPIFPTLPSAEITRKFLPLLMIYCFNYLKCEINQKLISEGIVWDFDGAKDAYQYSVIISCPRGKLDVRIKGLDKVISIEKNDEFIAIERLSLNDLEIEGKDNNTWVVLAKKII